MFWRFGGYANISTIDTLLDKPDVTLEELLDEADLIQELKQHNTKLIEYLREDHVLKRLLDYVTAPPLLDEDDDGEKEESAPPSTEKEDGEHDGAAKESDQSKDTMDRESLEKAEKQRLRYSYVACEVLSSETWSIVEAMMLNESYLRDFWKFLSRKAPLDALQAGYFTKVNEVLFDKKTEEMLEFFKSLDGIVPTMLKHVDNPMVMDLLLKIISLEKAEGGQGIVDWLKDQELIPTLLSYLSADYPYSSQTSAGDFLKAIITISANAAQNEQSCVGPNSLTRQLVSESCIQSLISAMLQGGNPLTVGVGIVIEVIRKNNSDYDPENVGGPDSAPSTHDPIYLGTLLRLFAKHVPDFMALILSSKHAVTTGGTTRIVERDQLSSAWGTKIEPLGFDRFKTCELMAELLHCSNMGLLNEIGSDEYICQRDAERERLRAQGAFAPHREDDSGVDYTDTTVEFGNGPSPSALGSGSPEDVRRLEVANVGEDDGFEDVGSSGVLLDVKDVPDEKATGQNDTNVGVRSSETADASASQPDPKDEFVDEPLTPPKHDNQAKGTDDEPGTQPRPAREPVSPTAAGITEKVEEFKLDNEAQKLASSDAERSSLEKAQSSASPEESLARPLSPHADDKPAPLFASKKTPTAEEQPPAAKQESEQSATAGDPEPSVQEDILPSIAFGDEGEQQNYLNVQMDPNGQPVVGDYLKIMFVENHVVPTILGFFFRFPWNNFLHNVVYDVVQQVFNGPMDRGFNQSLAIDLFETGRITDRVVEGQRRSDEAQATKRMRLGYMGHLTLIAEEVVKFSERHPPELLSPTVMEKVLDKDWIDYVERTLSETRERDNAILGGVRPDMSMGHRQAVLNAVNANQGFSNSSALANAGLNGGFNSGTGFDSLDLANQGGASGGVFNIGGGHGGGSQLSGFGSSSDDEDEEMEDQEDEEGAKEVSTKTAEGGSNNESTSSSSQPIPILPPPPSAPAPLNIPPSRARRQLAARLASKQAAAAAEGASASDSDQARDADNDEAPVNPFTLAANELDDSNEEANSGLAASFVAFPTDDFSPFDQDISSSPTFPRSGFTPPGSSSSASDDGDGEEAIRRKVRLPLEVDDDDEMGGMVAPTSGGWVSGDSDSDDGEPMAGGSLGYSKFFGGQSPEGDRNDSSDGEDDGLVEIFVPGRKSSSSG